MFSECQFCIDHLIFLLSVWLQTGHHVPQRGSKYTLDVKHCRKQQYLFLCIKFYTMISKGLSFLALQSVINR